MAGQLHYRDVKVALRPGESTDINVSYGLVIFSDVSTTSAYIGYLTGSVLNDIFKGSSSKITATSGSVWGDVSIINNSTENVNINVVIIT